ncbi:TonB family protein [Stieleria sp. ICT_E10.1]|uniref:energy transducer TonB n=1 Tax=Stieleria sedimenti TaxID=2976331 RepID=UPI00218005D6|nr:energy transducer TonB [Stieleria sedimenti]MCS7469480.1 TonB family protein [Stieleria sedimenti]
MSFPVRSTLVSLFLHAIGAAVLCVVPMAATERFSSAGQQHVVAIELSVASPTALDFPVQILPLPTIQPLAALDMSPPDRSEDTAKAQPSQTSRSTLLAAPPEFPELCSQADAALERQVIEAAKLPTIDTKVPVRPPRRFVRNVTPPPAIDAIPIPQPVGLSPETPVDFSSNPPPQYPLDAARNRLEGTVLLRLRVDTAGKVSEVEIIESSGHGSLDRAAVEAVKRWKGQPARRFGRAIASEEVLPVRFRL